MLKIDNNKCKRCLKCISECPTISIDSVENNIAQIEPSICLLCGHCISVCSHNAIAWDSQLELKPYSLMDFPSQNSQQHDIFIKTRSIRKFKKIKIEREMITKIISDAEMAPSGDNFRKREYLVVNSTETIEKKWKLYWLIITNQ